MNQYLSKMKNIDEIRDDLKKGTPYLMNKVKFDKINWFFSEKDKEKVKYIYDIPSSQHGLKQREWVIMMQLVTFFLMMN